MNASFCSYEFSYEFITVELIHYIEYANHVN